MLCAAFSDAARHDQDRVAGVGDVLPAAGRQRETRGKSAFTCPHDLLSHLNHALHYRSTSNKAKSLISKPTEVATPRKQLSKVYDLHEEV